MFEHRMSEHSGLADAASGVPDSAPGCRYDFIYNAARPDDITDMPAKFAGLRVSSDDVMAFYGPCGGRDGDPLERPAEGAGGSGERRAAVPSGSVARPATSPPVASPCGSALGRGSVARFNERIGDAWELRRPAPSPQRIVDNTAPEMPSSGAGHRDRCSSESTSRTTSRCVTWRSSFPGSRSCSDRTPPARAISSTPCSFFPGSRRVAP